MDNLSIQYSMQVNNTDGSIYDTGIRDCHSFAKGFGQLLYNVGFMVGTGNIVTIIDTSTTNLTFYYQMGFRVNAASGTATYGIQVGTGTNAESISDTKLQTQISHGTSAGNLQYGTVTFGAPSTTSTTTTFRITRVFTNGSAGTITVEEIGLATTYSGSSPILIIRDLTGSVSVGVGAQLTVNIDFTTTI